MDDLIKNVMADHTKVKRYSKTYNEKRIEKVKDNLTDIGGIENEQKKPKRGNSIE